MLIFAMAVWGSTFVAMKLVVTGMPAMVAVFIRMCLAVAAFAVLIKYVRKGVVYRKGDWRYLVLMALFEPCLYFLFESQALQYTSAGQAGMITSLFPILIAVSAFFAFGERLYRRQWLGLFIAVVGVIWMTLAGEESDQAPNPLLGNLLELAAMGAAVGYTLLVKHLTSRYPALFLTAMQACVGVVFFLPFALDSQWPDSIGVDMWLLLIYLGVGATLGAYGLFNYALTHVDATVAAGYVNLIPAFAVLFSVVFLGDEINLWQWLAIALVFVGVYLSRDSKVDAQAKDNIPAA
ncbi:DMT family transporter [Bermanella marisrubri]|uniref:EamA domain-containing protein n=2 Tax=Bermanella marisrubri TaxID=207949 RepID=Q1N285_9GAMM|nr:hypothetical protein RED65_15608 [Bermanella marisrubri]QIZ85878.1 DMT family transporter [Bermanella marisrubri]